MNISDRYRQLLGDTRALLAGFPPASTDEAAQPQRFAAQALQGLAELEERVGEIPRIRLESQLTPVLLKAHSQLDRARMLLEEQGEEDRAAAVWETEQKIYRLLNEL